MSTDKRMDFKNVVYIFSGILLCLNKEYSPAFSNMDEP
jgi:hypothetical protein